MLFSRRRIKLQNVLPLKVKIKEESTSITKKKLGKSELVWQDRDDVTKK